MGEFVNSLWLGVLAWIVTILIIGLNAKLLFGQVAEWLK
jgi:Mn2+/Fe2+ NRAMP family transporter